MKPLIENISEVKFCTWYATPQKLSYQYYVRYTIDGKKKVKFFYMSNKEPTQGQYFHTYFTACHFQKALMSGSIDFKDYDFWKRRVVYGDSTVYVGWHNL